MSKIKINKAREYSEKWAFFDNKSIVCSFIKPINICVYKQIDFK